MTRSLSLLAALLGFLLMLLVPVAIACGAYGFEPLPKDVIRVLGAQNPVDYERVVRRHRDKGPAGLAELLASSPAFGDDLTEAEWSEFIDQVAGQRDASRSGLYWYTDLDAALAASELRQVPVLSLRMLGDLRDEFSCANSRFFRTVLYTDPDLSTAMRRGFVLHWSSERDVPRVSIDFGDGRTVETTVTGNSAHYILDSEGRPLDVLPGLYSGREFGEQLDQATRLYTKMARTEPEGRDAALRDWHASRLEESVREVSEAYWKLPLTGGAGMVRFAADPVAMQAWMSSALIDGAALAPAAVQAMEIAMGKMAIERPLLQAIPLGHPPPMPPAGGGLVPRKIRPSLVSWPELAPAIASGSSLSAASLQLMRDENPAMDAASFEAMREAFESSIALDTLNNEFRLHSLVHSWFAEGSEFSDLETLNERVYRELFLTPRQDPWLGLVDTSVYSGLELGGVSGVEDLPVDDAVVANHP